MGAKDKRTATENFRSRWFIIYEKYEKNLMGGASPPPTPLYVRGLKDELVFIFPYSGESLFQESMPA